MIDKLITLLIVIVAYLIMMRTMALKDRRDPWTWVTIASCFVAIVYGLFRALAVVPMAH